MQRHSPLPRRPLEGRMAAGLRSSTQLLDGPVMFSNPELQDWSTLTIWHGRLYPSKASPAFQVPQTNRGAHTWSAPNRTRLDFLGLSGVVGQVGNYMHGQYPIGSSNPR